jgi:hypothetical protein
MLRFENLQTPSADGDVLIEPCARQWPSLLEENLRSLNRQDITLAGVSASELRRAVRSDLLGLAPDQPIIAAGHQPEFVHPGVWAKYVVVRELADSAGAAGIDLVVDNDAPRSGSLAVPVPTEDSLLKVREFVFTAGTPGSAYEGRATVSPEQAAALTRELADLLGERFTGSLMPAYLQGLSEHAGAIDAVGQHLAARAGIDANAVARLAEYRVSRVVGGPFVADLLIDAARFAQAYNQSLADYRRDQGLRNVHRPLPDLGQQDGRIETALWIYQPGQRRRRLWVEPQGETVALHADAECVGSVATRDLKRDADDTLAGLRPWVIRPRALALTLWARLLACDLFVHGIGGAKYDRITDGIFRRYYGCRPPAYTCVSATLRLPWAMFPVTPADLMASARRVRDWRFNPGRYCANLPPDLLSEREQLIRRSDELRANRGPHPERRTIFTAIRGVNTRLVESRPEVGRELTEFHARLARESESNRVAAGREYFYALQPHPRLERLAARLVEATELSKR